MTPSDVPGRHLRTSQNGVSGLSLNSASSHNLLPGQHLRLMPLTSAQNGDINEMEATKISNKHVLISVVYFGQEVSFVHIKYVNLFSATSVLHH